MSILPAACARPAQCHTSTLDDIAYVNTDAGGVCVCVCVCAHRPAQCHTRTEAWPGHRHSRPVIDHSGTPQSCECDRSKKPSPVIDLVTAAHRRRPVIDLGRSQKHKPLAGVHAMTPTRVGGT